MSEKIKTIAGYELTSDITDVKVEIKTHTQLNNEILKIVTDAQSKTKDSHMNIMEIRDEWSRKDYDLYVSFNKGTKFSKVKKVHLYREGTFIIIDDEIQNAKDLIADIDIKEEF